MKIKLVFIILLPLIQYVSGYKILIAIPCTSKSVHHLFSSLSLALAENRNEVTFFTSFQPSVSHKNIENFRPEDFSSSLLFKNWFELNSQLDFLMWVRDLFKSLPDKVWKNEEVWNLYRRRNEFDAIISTSYANEVILPFLDGYNGTYIVVCTPGIEYNCISYSGNWLSMATVPNINLPYDETLSFFERVENSFAFVIEKIILYTVIEPTFGVAIRKYFPDFTTTTEYLRKSHLTLVNGHFSLDGPTPLLPNQIEIGTINARDPQPLPKDIQEIFDQSGPEGVIYFSLGSFVDAKRMPEKNREILLEAFRRLPHKIIWKYEDDISLPPNVHARKWLPQQDILGHPKTKIFISHCGNLGTQEAKYHGVPVLSIPIAFDQHRNAARLERKKYGITLTWDEMTVENILKAVQTLTEDNTYSLRMKNISRILHDQKEAPGQRAVWWIEYVIRHKGAPHLQYAGKRLSFYQYIMLDVLVVWMVVLSVTLYLFTFCSLKLFKKIFKSKIKKD